MTKIVTGVSAISIELGIATSDHRKASFIADEAIARNSKIAKIAEIETEIRVDQ